MKAQNTFGISFLVRRSKPDNGKVLIYASIRVNGKRIEMSLKHSIDAKDWSGKKGQGIGNHPDIIKLNQYLLHVKSRLVECYRELQLDGEIVTAELVKKKFIGEVEDPHTLLKLVEYHNKTMDGILAPGTLKNYYTTVKYLKSYIKKQYKLSDYPLRKLSYQFITDFEHFLRSHEPLDHQKPIGNNGVMKHLERFRKVVAMGARLEWIDKDPFVHYKLRFKRPIRTFLTAKELESIELKQLSIPRLKYVRDLFVFSCYTGLSYIDAIQLKPDDISIEIDGEHWIFIKRQKTDEPVRIPILPKAQEIIDSYKDNPKAININRVFPNISNQKLNSYLKEIADLCNIRKTLTFHVARHTFATTVTLTNGVPLETVSKLLGHSSVQTTQIYAKILEQKVSHDMSDLRKVLNQKKEVKNKIV